MEVFLDYQVLDDLLRLEESRYNGSTGMELISLQRKAVDRELSIWMSEIARVEMVHGIQNPSIAEEKRIIAERKDQAKLAIASGMHVKWLIYPCAKIGDGYSLLDLSFRIAGPEWADADAMERVFEQTPGISKGDARHLVSWIFGVQTDQLDYRPNIDHFVSEDKPLRRALTQLQAIGSISALATAQILSVEELIHQL